MFAGIGPPSRSPAPGVLALRILATLAVAALLYIARPAVAPVAVAVLLSLLLMAPVELLHRHGVPRAAAALGVSALLLCALAGVLNLLWTAAQEWWAAAPQTIGIIEARSRPLALWLGRIDLIDIHAAAPAPADLALQILAQTRDVTMSLITTVLTMLFLLIGGPPMLTRLGSALAGERQARRWLLMIYAVRSAVSRYYASIVLINLGLGLATAAMIELLGVPNPLLWGAVAATLNFIPYIGSAITLLLLTLVAFVTFASLPHVALVTFSFLALATLEGQLLQPWVVGRRLELHPLLVLLALWFGGWFWGIAGIVVAVPILLSLKVVLRHSDIEERGELPQRLAVPERTAS